MKAAEAQMNDNCVTNEMCFLRRPSIPKVIHIYKEQNRPVDSLIAMTTTIEGSFSLRLFLGGNGQKGKGAHASLEDIFSANRYGVVSVRRVNALTVKPYFTVCNISRNGSIATNG